MPACYTAGDQEFWSCYTFQSEALKWRVNLYLHAFLNWDMKIDKYDLKAGRDLTVFEFVSEGTNGAIPKLILIQSTTEPNLYNLAFGDKDRTTGTLNMAVSNNGDTDKVLATVIAALYAFFDWYPNAFVYASGSTVSRTRLYRMGITRFYKEMGRDFYLYGRVGDDFPAFEIGKEYSGFLARRKF